MMYRIPVEIVVHADTPSEAIEALIGELDYLFKLDNSLVAYTHPDESEVKEEA